MRLRVGCLVVLLCVTAMPAHAQSLRDQFENLFTFGTCGQPLCLSVDAGQHGSHFIPSRVQSAGNLLSFLTNAIGTSLTSVPVAATSGGTTFTFAGGIPVATSTSTGPIFAERAQTLGRGRWLFGANVTGASFKSIRGVPLNDVELTFTHQNVGSPALGDPLFENDLINVQTAIDLDVLSSSFFIAYGLLDRVDLAVAVPLVHTSLSGHSMALILPVGRGLDTTQAHFFGTAANPQLAATSTMDGSATGIGDVTARMKINLRQTPKLGIALLGEVRFPTGDEEQFLGSGSTSATGMGIVSGRAGDFSPHLNVGYTYRGGELQNDAILATAGFDHLLAPWATFAADLITRWQVGKQALVLPPPAEFTVPFQRTVPLSDIPNERDNLVDAAIGAKLSASRRLTLVANSLIPINRGGIRADVIWTLGAEFNFYPGSSR